MKDFEAKFEDLLKRGYEISFSEKDNFNQFAKVQEKIFYASFKKNGKVLLHFPSRTSSKKAFLDGYYFIPKVEKLLNKQK